MLVWPDGTVTGSVNVEELAAIREALSSKGGMKHPDDNPIEHVSQLVKGKSHAVIADPTEPTTVEAVPLAVDEEAARRDEQARTMTATPVKKEGK